MVRQPVGAGEVTPKVTADALLTNHRRARCAVPPQGHRRKLESDLGARDAGPSAPEAPSPPSSAPSMP